MPKQEKTNSDHQLPPHGGAGSMESAPSQSGTDASEANWLTEPKLTAHLGGFLSAADQAALSTTSKEAAKTFHIPFKNNFMELGIPESTVDILLSLIKDPRRLSAQINKFRTRAGGTLIKAEAWMLCCLSGDTDAIRRVDFSVLGGEEPTEKKFSMAVLLATFSGKLDAIQLVMEKTGFNPGSNPQENGEFMLAAALSGNTSVMNFAKENWKLNPSSINSSSFSQAQNVLHAAAFSGNTEAMKLAKSWGLDSNITDYEGRTCLHFAALSGDPEAMKLAKSWGLDPKQITTFREYTALDYATMSGNIEAMKLAKEAWEITLDEQRIFMLAILSGNLAAAELANEWGLDAFEKEKWEFMIGVTKAVREQGVQRGTFIFLTDQIIASAITQGKHSALRLAIINFGILPSPEQLTRINDPLLLKTIEKAMAEHAKIESRKKETPPPPPEASSEPSRRP